MKKLFFALVVLSSSIVYAAEVKVAEVSVPYIRSFDSFVSARFQMNTTTGEGFVNFTVTEDRYFGDSFPRPHDRPGRHPMPVVVYQDTVKVDGLMLMGDKIVYHTEEGAIDCGTLGESRIFKKPTIYLSGNCKLSGRVTGNWNNSKATVTLITK